MADSTWLLKSANCGYLWSCFRHFHMRFADALFAGYKFGSRYSGSQTKPTRAERRIFAQDLSAQPLQGFAAPWALNVLHAECSTQEGPSRVDPSISAPDESLRTKLAGHGSEATQKRWRGCLTRSLLCCGRGECLRNRKPKLPWAVFERILHRSAQFFFLISQVKYQE